ncbi:hypothetical protein M406DRAFT_248021 [Cryphonectria parasitica EP155]|uniref:Mitochondrial chaperone BCS1 n=1 Tax=Cryphonectria parasitica (strain ATCC 38755 / EP155) TaxID=660469 RepID=A0A9P4YEF6_CRYP1|nr:uncharacterized protein M406DRAFT_248021 [Cryphonectria parasitica EP155]KAF3770985.1 hypothetical protein M406DRAFT_248021 [Cryphonectria parasitica EP155]
MTGNITATPGLESIIALLGARNPIVQVLMLLHQTIGTRIGVDPTVFLSFLGFLWASNRIWRQLFTTVQQLVSNYLTSSIHVSSSDEIFMHLMKWLSAQPHLVNSRALTAETVSKTAWEGEDEAEVLSTRISADGGGVYLNFSNEEAKMPPRFIPALGVHAFWFEGNYFRLTRKQESFMDDENSGSGMFKDRENLTISCFGRSPEPIKRMLQKAKENYYSDHHSKTTVKRPSALGNRRFGRGAWAQVAQRPVRPMKTVVLDVKQKIQVLADINEYLHPATPHWYANRGIPLRRGYLFHGPPGTGKTSLSFALAGVFGLDIFVISLLEPTLTEEDLLALFNSLPRRCVVLLEDIDTAGLTRPKDEEQDDEKAADEPTKNNNGEPGRSGGRKRKGDGGDGERGGANDWKVSDLARELKKPFNEDKKGISLSGLLNAIDGVASHEGRVLIMTTNKPETLDDALIRPGRVDLQVAFTNATQEQARELFERMYEADSKHKHTAAANGHASKANGHASPDEKSEKANGYPQESEPMLQNGGSVSTSEVLHDERLDLTFDELKIIAAEFAEKIPDGQFSPAELQGFLLKRKKNPRKALEEVGVWVEGMLKQKASKTKILQVQ